MKSPRPTVALQHLALGAALIMVPAACDTKVKQAKPPSFADEPAGAVDMAAEPEPGPTPVIETKTMKRGRCCQKCVDAKAKDRSPDPAEKTPCLELTADIGEECIKWFRKNPMSAAEAVTCTEDAKKKAAEEAKKSDDE